MIERRNIKKAVAYAMLLCFTSLTGAQPLYAIPANTQLPTGGNTIIGEVKIPSQSEIVNNTMNITQSSTTSVIQWGNFSIGADATVNFIGKNGVDFTGHNSLNYVTNGGPISEIYGQLNALGGNIFIANPAGVQIGNSAQINVGSLYVTNKDVSDLADKITATHSAEQIANAIKGLPVAQTNAELMSLGSITSATNVTFDGSRIVLDTDRLFTEENGVQVPIKEEQITNMLAIRTNDKDNVVLGYTGYRDGKFSTDEKTFGNITVVDEYNNVVQDDDTVTGYMWVENLEQLQNMDDRLSGWFALRNSIDAYDTASMNGGKGFAPIGGSDSDKFTGRFDGLGYNIFGLTIKRNDENNVGLFGHVSGENAVVRNLTLNDGEITGNNNVGSVAGLADGGARIEKITNTADVSGMTNVGGIAGQLTSSNNSETTTVTDLVNIGTVSGHENVGGIIGYAEGIDLKGTVYNIGGVAGEDAGSMYSNKIGGLIGEAYNSTIGDGTNLIYNRAGVTGGYDVGGIAGYVHGYRNTITNAANYGDVTATGFTETKYQYHTLVNDASALPNGAQTADDKGNVLATVEGVRAANAGGIAGRSDGDLDSADKLVTLRISNVSNYGDVTTLTETVTDDDNGKQYSYYIAGNTGGIVGSATNTEISNAENSENKISGAHNVGGIAGYMDGESKVSGSGNDGGEITATGARNASGFVQEWVSNQDGNDEKFYIGNAGGIVGYLFGAEAKITNSGNRGKVHSEPIIDDYVSPAAQAANVGGVAGKIDVTDTVAMESIKKDDEHYTETGTISNSYNTGEVRGYTGVGGIAGQMYKGSVVASYNLGTVQTTRTAGGSNQDKDPLNMGGIVGDTSTIADDEGTAIYDVYNAGQIGDETFNYYGRHVGGVVGRLSGDMEKAYNTGEIYNGYSVVGGIAGWWVGGNIKNVFNTGNITVLNKDKSNYASEVGGIVGAYGGSGNMLSYAYNLGTLRSIKLSGAGATGTATALGGIVGRIRGKELKIDNVYTTNNIYAAFLLKDAVHKDTSQGNNIGVIYGDIDNDKGEAPTISKSYFVKVYDDEAFEFGSINLDGVNAEGSIIDGETESKNISSYDSFNFYDVNNPPEGNYYAEGWRIEDGTLPILYAFTPNMAKKESAWNPDGKYSVQYGTAANPLLTIINANGDVTLDWDSLNISGAGSIAVYGNESLTINGFNVELGSHYNGTLYSDGTLTINAAGGGDGALYNLGSGSRLYGSSVTFDAQGVEGTAADDKDAALYGKITATNGGVGVKGKNVTILGELTSSASDTTITGIAGTLDTSAMDFREESLNNLDAPVSTVGDAYATKVTEDTNVENRDVDIDASGRAEVLFGSMGGGKITTGGDLSVTGEQGIFVDSDFHIGGDMNMMSEGEIVLDLSNMGKTAGDEDEDEISHMHDHFLDHFKTNGKINVRVADEEDFIIGLDMWKEGKFDSTKYDRDDDTLEDDIDVMNIEVNGQDVTARDHTFLWIENAAQLKGVQESAGSDAKILTYNFALKDDIDASALTDYKEIGGTTGYSGTFDGRDFRIIGLNAAEENKEDASSGIFSRLTGTVKDLRVYASNFFGDGESAGAIAAVNEGTITGVTTFGNSVEAKYAGGVAGENSGSIFESTASDSVTANGKDSYAGGITGVNSRTIGEEGDYGNAAEINANSAVRSGTDGAAAIGGAVGKNKTDGKVWLTNSLGVTTGTKSAKTGGIVGENAGVMTSLYNESIVTGQGDVGGVAGTNSGTMKNAINVTAVAAAGENAGGIAGTNSGKIESGRNAGAITGTTNVGGMVGVNEKEGVLQNLSNAVAATIKGEENVGGVAGTNSGTITGDDNLENKGRIEGTTNVGGIAGVNEVGGVIENPNNDVTLIAVGEDAKNFGGVAGVNKGTITNATNRGVITAYGAQNVGGITGVNEESGLLDGAGNEGIVIGGSHVAGVAGVNESTNPRGRIENSGTVIATNGGAAGIIYENTANLGGKDKKLALINSGTVVGFSRDESHGTGGIIGVNSGNVSYASLISTVASAVTGGWNTGGLIGYNTGTIEGGRADNKTNGLGYYAYKIFNNGEVTGTKNTGGLIGNNAKDGDKTGTLIAGYNTGRVTGVTAGDSTVNVDGIKLPEGVTIATELKDKFNGDGSNVGGIAGTNAGLLDQIFNFVMMKDKNDKVSGVSNTGGVAGSNSGNLTNAYNATAVEATGVSGNIAGTNAGTIENVYATYADGKLIGKTENAGTVEHGYSFSAGDDSVTNVLTGGEQKQAASYEGFDFGDMWKIYEGYGAPLLKVFLTEAKYYGETGLMQTGGPLCLPISGVTAGDNLAAYRADNSLLVALKNAGVGGGYLAFASQQIALDGSNWLGYDIDATYNIKPNPAMLLTQNNGHLHWLHRGGERHRNFRERKAEIYFHEGGMIHE